MRVLLESISDEPELGRVLLRVRFGDEASKDFLGEYDGSDAKCRVCNVETDLFMQLSDLAFRRYCNCTVYHIELMGIIAAYLERQPLPEFPIELGTTRFASNLPSRMRITVDRLRRPFILAWYRWKLRPK